MDFLPPWDGLPPPVGWTSSPRGMDFLPPGRGGRPSHGFQRVSPIHHGTIPRFSARSTGRSMVPHISPRPFHRGSPQQSGSGLGRSSKENRSGAIRIPRQLHSSARHAPDQTRPDQTGPDQTRPDQTRPDPPHGTCIKYPLKPRGIAFLPGHPTRPPPPPPRRLAAAAARHRVDVRARAHDEHPALRRGAPREPSRGGEGDDSPWTVSPDPLGAGQILHKLPSGVVSIQEERTASSFQMYLAPRCTPMLPHLLATGIHGL
eukprot:gene23461-biopygen10345